MSQRREEVKGTKTLCDLVYQNITTESHSSTIHRSPNKPRLSFVPVSSKLYNKNRRTIDLKDSKREQYPIVCYNLHKKDTDNISQSAFVFGQLQNQPKIIKIALSKLRGITPKTTKRSDTRTVQASRDEKMIAYNAIDYSKKVNKRGYQKQRQRLKTSKLQMSTFFSNYQRVSNYPKLDNCLDGLKSEIIKKYSTKFRLLESL